MPKEEPLTLFQIDALIKQTDYNEALKQLYIYIKKYPDDFDRAQVLIKRIMNQRQKYSVLTEMAMKASEENPEDHETPAKIILEMRSIEKNPPAEIKYVIDMIEEMHLFKYYAYMFDTIIAEGAALTQKEQYSNAVKKLHEGFWIYKEEFEDEWKDYPDIINQVHEIVTELEKQIQLVLDEDLRKKFDESVAQFNQYLKADNFIAANNALLNVKNYYFSYAGIQNDIVYLGMQLQEVYEKQKELKPEINDASYIPFLTRFVIGMNSLADSGINGAILYKLGRAVEDMKAGVATLVTKYYSNLYAALPSELFGSSQIDVSRRTYLTPIQNYVKLGKDVCGLYGICINNDGTQYEPMAGFEEGLNRIEGIVQISFKLLDVAVKVKREDTTQQTILSRFMNKDKTVSSDELAADVDLLFESVSKMNGITGLKSTLALENQAFYKASKKKDIQPPPTILQFTKPVDISVAERAYKRYIDQIFNRSNGASSLAWNVITDYYTKLSDSYVADILSVSTDISAFNEGFSEKIPPETLSSIKNNPKKLVEYAAKAKKDSSAAIIYRYPSLALAITSYINNQSDLYLHDLTLAQEKIMLNFENNPDWNNVESIKSKVKQSDSYLNRRKDRLNELKKAVLPIVTRSEQMFNEAVVAKEQAEEFMERAETEYKRGNYDSAQKYLQQAGEKYAISLSIENDENVSRQSDERRFALDEKIVDAKNTLVVQQSREFYNLARDALNYNRFDDAERYMNSAIAKWAETHVDLNPEFETFKILVNNAVSMESGRELHQSDALYEDMSQLLNIANQYYQEGVKKINDGDSAGGKESFEQAIENLDKLKKVYPLNQKAFLLRMNIEKIQNPQKYAAEFKQKIQDAVKKCDNAVTAAEGLGELKAYYEQDPSYPGLRQTIENMEIKLGRRQKKADETSVAKSNERVRTAQRMFDSAGKDSKKLNDALAVINEALQLNPNNTRAEALKDKISTKIGGSTSVVLTAEEQQLLTLAKNEYGSQNIEAAYGYILQLYQRNPSCGKIKDVNDTRRRIESRL
ncbi:MAG: HEPN domain-containing protein [Treponema sp.]|nr:HEPN domain-containing protein [Treponema sp.]